MRPKEKSCEKRFPLRKVCRGKGSAILAAWQALFVFCLFILPQTFSRFFFLLSIVFSSLRLVLLDFADTYQFFFLFFLSAMTGVHPGNSETPAVRARVARGRGPCTCKSRM
jgi:hypothetical protein